MIELLLIALASTVIATLLVWLYRKLTEAKGINCSLVTLSNHNRSLRLSQQQGFVTLRNAGPGKQRTAAKQQRDEGSVRKPWGW